MENIIEVRNTKGMAYEIVNGQQKRISLRSLGCPEEICKQVAESRARKANAEPVVQPETEARREKLAKLSL